MFKFLSILQKNLVWSIPISMAFGLLFGYLFDASPLKSFIIPVTFIMVYPMMVTLNVKGMFKGGDYKLQLTTQIINFILIPIVAYFTGKFFFAGGPEKYVLWGVGLFLIGVLPTSGMTISWTGFAKGNKEAAIKMVVFGLVLGSLAAPIYTKLVMGATIDVNMLHMFKQVALFVFVPLAAGLITQSVLKRKYGEKTWNQQIKPKFPPFSAFGVVLIAFVAMSLKAKNIIANPGDIVTILVPLIVFYLVSYVLLTITGKLFFKRGDAIAMVFGVVMRDLSIALAIAMTAFGKQGLTIALLISLAYVVQIQSAAWYVKFVETFFGKAEKPIVPQPGTDSDGADTTLSGEPETGEPLVPTIRNILFATDLSETARHAVRYACSIGNRYDASVTVLHVIPDLLEQLEAEAGADLTTRAGEEGTASYNEAEIEAARQTIQKRVTRTSRLITKEIPSCPLDNGEILVKVGSPADNILEAVETGDYDMVVMGTHGHGLLEESLIGSVANEVIQRSTKPVLVVRMPR
jgi:arsenite transporter